MSRAATAPNRAREYETIYILRPDIDADGAERIGARVAEVVGRESGRLTKVESWGRRRLAYDIGKQRRGVYIYLKYLGGGKVVAEIERNLRLTDGVIKYQTVLVRSDVEDEVHLHGYNVMRDVGPGMPARLRFRATIPGGFEAELEDRGLQIADITVKP